MKLSTKKTLFLSTLLVVPQLYSINEPVPLNKPEESKSSFKNKAAIVGLGSILTVITLVFLGKKSGLFAKKDAFDILSHQQRQQINQWQAEWAQSQDPVRRAIAQKIQEIRVSPDQQEQLHLTNELIAEMRAQVQSNNASLGAFQAMINQINQPTFN